MFSMSVRIDAPDGFSVLTMRSSSAASETKSSSPVPPFETADASRSRWRRSRSACCASNLRSISAICSATATISSLMSSMRRLSSAGSRAVSSSAESSSSVFLIGDPDPGGPTPPSLACFMDSESISFLDAREGVDDRSLSLFGPLFVVRSEPLRMSRTASRATSAAPYAASLALLPKMLRMKPLRASGLSSWVTPASSSSA
mmetsp:Transcript_5608/g.22950  ORF Transcript_5608/g.22950 Transcript_5608/m.22950 type:complete len:202 (+) Transcript_5608:225-830(+)